MNAFMYKHDDNTRTHIAYCVGDLASCVVPRVICLFNWK